MTTSLKKPRTTANPSSWSPAHHHNAPQLGIAGATAIGVGGMVGGGIFAVLGTAVSIAGGGTPLAFILAGVIALLTAYSYAKLSVAFPSAGGTVVFLDRAFGIDLATGTLNVMLWLCYLVTIALYAAAFGAYGATFFSHPAPSVELKWSNPTGHLVKVVKLPNEVRNDNREKTTPIQS